MGKLILKYGNILDYLDGMDAIVNSTNKYMTCGSGVCGAIYKKANKDKLEEYCRNNFSRLMEVNETRITPGFDLGVDIIHIYCPKAYDSIEPIKQLLVSYENIFKTANVRGYKNILSISLGTGIHGYKHNEISKEVVDKLNKLTSEFNINIILVLINEETRKIYNNINIWLGETEY